jgi:bzd-type benzoyl-CoA reductase N subunit
MGVQSLFSRSIPERHEIAREWKRRNRPVVGWTCSYTPEELVFATGALPVMVWGGLGDTRLADAYMPSNSCSFARGCFNAVLKGEYDYLDALVETNSCDNRGKTYDMYVNYAKIPRVYFINAPGTDTEKAHEFYYHEVVRFKEWLESSFGRVISDDSLRDAIEVYNENRALLREIYDLKMKKPPLISGYEFMELALSGFVMPRDEHNKLLKQLLGSVGDRSDFPDEGVRLLVSGSVMDNSELVRLIESVGGNVVADDLCTGSRYFWNRVELNGNLLKAVARRYLSKVPSSFMFGREERFRHAVDLARRFDVDGVVMFVIRYCDTHMFDAPLLRDEFKAAGLPVLYLEWEHSLSGLAGLKTRIEAFVEMVGGVK